MLRVDGAEEHLAAGKYALHGSQRDRMRSMMGPK